jgi:hypothetical protein
MNGQSGCAQLPLQLTTTKQCFLMDVTWTPRRRLKYGFAKSRPFG